MNQEGLPLHPFYPKDVLLSGDIYLPNTWPVSSLILTFAALWTLVLGLTLFVSFTIHPGLKDKDRALILWFVLSTSPNLSQQDFHSDPIDQAARFTSSLKATFCTTTRA